MPVTDIHAHLFTDELLARMADSGMQDAPHLVEEPDGQVLLVLRKGYKAGPIPNGIRDVDQRLADMDRQGVDVQVLAAAPMLFGYGEAEEIARRIASGTNDVLMDVARAHPERFQVFASLPLSVPSAVAAELDRVADDPVVRGVQIGTHVEGMNLDDPALETGVVRAGGPGSSGPWCTRTKRPARTGCPATTSAT